MIYYAGLDVSLKEISICVVDADGKTVARCVSPADAEGVVGWFRAKSLSPRLIVHESGQLSIWLQRGLERLGLPTICSMRRLRPIDFAGFPGLTERRVSL